MDLQAFAAEYSRRNDVSSAYAQQLRWAVQALARYLNRPATISDLTSEQINQWLYKLREQAYSPETRRGRRRMLLTLAADAARQGLLAPVNRDMIAKVRSTPKLPDGLTWLEARRVIDALTLVGTRHERWLRYRYRSTGISRRDWWTAYLAACWDTGAPADLRLLTFDEISPSGLVSRLRAKTGKLLRWQLSPFALEAIGRIHSPRRLVFPLAGGIGLFRSEARKILHAIAGLPAEKSLGGFRSGAGTDAELRHGSGAGCQLLGNTPAVFQRHYEIQPVLQRPVMSPRPLMGASSGRTVSAISEGRDR
jgi:hypothetical protein